MIFITTHHMIGVSVIAVTFPTLKARCAETSAAGHVAEKVPVNVPVKACSGTNSVFVVREVRQQRLKETVIVPCRKIAVILVA